MAVSKGFGTKMGWKKATTWGTPVAVGATNQKEYHNEKLTPKVDLIDDEALSGKGTHLFGDKGNEFHSGEVEFPVRYEGLEDIIGMAMGDANGGSAPTQVGSDNAYKHILKPKDDKEGLFGTLVIGKSVGVWEYTTCKVGGFNFKAVPGKRPTISVPFIPQGLNINTGGGTNGNTQVAALTLPTNRDFALFNQLKVQINVQSAGALANADLVYIADFEVKLDNSFPTDDVSTKYGNLIDEPIQDGFAQVTGSLKWNVYRDDSPGGNDQMIAALMSKARKKMIATWTGPAIGATFYSVTMYFPDVQFDTGDVNVGGPGRVPVNLNFVSARVLAIPTGFPAGYTDALTIEIVNQKNVNAL